MRFLLFSILSVIWFNSPEVGFATVQSQRVELLILEGASRTDRDWLLSYLGIKFPTTLSAADLKSISKRLLTTEVFSEVATEIVPVTDAKGQSFALKIVLVEKWTTIPVVRGAYGGGTPLAVLGVYDTHSFGRLWTLGAEGHRYGNAPWGAVVWARAPRYFQGNHELGVEMWRQFRLRTLYDERGSKLGEARSDWSMQRLLVMSPGRVSFIPFKFGLDLRFRQEAAVRYHPGPGKENLSPLGVDLTRSASRQTNPMLRLVYDEMSVDNLFLDGFRGLATWGPIYEGNKADSKYEVEAFYFKWWPAQGWNAGLHALAGQVTSNSVESQYFLGGFESIRGLPDGLLFGNRAYYMNFELRHLTYQMRYTWLQTAVFTDMGGAGFNWDNAWLSTRTTAGVGLRLAVPQVYRLMFRLDYAWDLEKPRMSGFTLGMNQFFQPYKPL